MRHPILSTITKELFNFRSRAQGYLALFPELQARPFCCTTTFFRNAVKLHLFCIKLSGNPSEVNMAFTHIQLTQRQTPEVCACSLDHPMGGAERDVVEVHLCAPPTHLCRACAAATQYCIPLIE